jgi:hypothetical protein
MLFGHWLKGGAGQSKFCSSPLFRASPRRPQEHFLHWSGRSGQLGWWATAIICILPPRHVTNSRDDPVNRLDLGYRRGTAGQAMAGELGKPVNSCDADAVVF